eukprot:80448-Heterocapsa_arctica.AAC.1
MQALQAVGKSPHGRCNGAHSHLPWGVKASGAFRTAEEAEYPLIFCKIVARIVRANTHDPPTVDIE